MPLLLRSHRLPRVLAASVATLTALTAVLCAASLTAARERHETHGAVVAPARGGGLTGSELLGEDWAQGLARPFSSDPLSGRCRTLVRNVLIPAIGEDGTSTCTATRRTRLFVFFGTAYTSLDDPFPTTEADQLAASLALDRQVIRALKVTVDRRTVDIRTRRFELFSPQRTAQLPADNFYGVDAGTTLTFTAHAWGAVIHGLRPGRHIVTVDVDAPEWGDPHFTVVLEVVRGRHSDNADHDDHDDHDDEDQEHG